MLNIDGFAYTNHLRHVHPLEKAAFAFATMFLCIGFSVPVVSCIVIILMSCVIVGVAGIPIKVYFKLMSLPCSFLLIGVIAIAVSITTQDQEAGYLAGVTVCGIKVGITSSGIKDAGNLLLKSLGAVSCLYFFSLTTPAVEMAAVMRKLKIPSLFIELTDLIYRFIFVMLALAGDIHTSQSSRWGYASLKNSIKSLGQLTAALLVKTLYRSHTLYTALSSRGYNGQLNVLTPEYAVSLKNICIIVILEAAITITAILLEMGKNG